MRIFYCILAVFVGTSSLAGGVHSRYETQADVQHFDQPMAARTIEVGEIDFSTVLQNPNAPFLRCSLRMQKGDQGQKIVTKSAGMVRVDDSIRNIIKSRVTYNGTAAWRVNLGNVPDGAAVDADIDFNSFGGRLVDHTQTQCWLVERTTPCENTQNSICALDRFQVEAFWQDGNQSGEADVDQAFADWGYFNFFDAGAQDLLVQVLNNCTDGFRFWVFMAANITDVEYSVRVTDTETGVTRTYTNPDIEPAQTLTDTDAFLTCP